MKRLFGILAMICGITSCGLDEKTGSVKPELRSLASAASLRLMNRTTTDISSNLSITTLKAPLKAILLEADNGDVGEIYKCDADDCMINLATASLDDLLDASEAEIKEGTYTKIRFETCWDSGGYETLIEASATLNDQTYVTTEEGSPVVGSTAAESSVKFSGCSTSYNLQKSIAIKEGETQDVKFYFDIRAIAWMADGDQSNFIPGGCTGEQTGAYLCVAYPNVFGTIDQIKPTVHRYVVNDSVVMGFYVSGSTGEYLTGYSRRYFSDGYISNSFTADTPLKDIGKNADGSLIVSNFGSSRDGPGYFNAENFPVLAIGESKSGLEFTDQLGNTLEYSVRRLD